MAAACSWRLDSGHFPSLVALMTPTIRFVAGQTIRSWADFPEVGGAGNVPLRPAISPFACRMCNPERRRGEKCAIGRMFPGGPGSHRDKCERNRLERPGCDGAAADRNGDAVARRRGGLYAVVGVAAIG